MLPFRFTNKGLNIVLLARTLRLSARPRTCSSVTKKAKELMIDSFRCYFDMSLSSLDSSVLSVRW